MMEAPGYGLMFRDGVATKPSEWFYGVSGVSDLEGGCFLGTDAKRMSRQNRPKAARGQ